MQPLLVLTTLSTIFFTSTLSSPSITTVSSTTNPAISQPYPRSEEETTTTTTTTSINNESYYYLKTQLKFPNSLHRFATNKNNLYLTSYHTGAGLADAVLDADKSHARPGYLRNDSRFAFPTGGLDWFLGLELPRPLEMWHPIRYSLVAHPTAGFAFNATGELECKPDDVPQDALHQWQGWLACDWHFGKPQLFWWTPQVGNGMVPTTCDVVSLVKELAE